MSNNKNVIYQIGRFDKNINVNINFKIEKSLYSAPLSSFALKDHFIKEDHKAEVTLCYPISLFFDKRFHSWELPEDFKEKIKRIEKEKNAYLKNPVLWFKLHPHSSIADDILVLHSVGEYEGEKFFTTFEVLILEIFFHMLEKYLTEPYTHLYLDISSGLNIYISALVEAGRLLSTFCRLSNWIQPDLKVYIVFSDPILGAAKREYNLYKDYEIKSKVFFSAPIKIRGENDFVLAKYLTENKKEKRAIKRKLQNLFSMAYLFFSAIKNNIPLALYSFNPHSPEEIEKGLRVILDLGWEKIRNNYQSCPSISKDLFTKAIFLLALYCGIVKALQVYKISPKREVTITELKKTFCDSQNNPTFYDIFRLPLNSSYLRHEISNNFENKKKKEQFLTQWKLLRCFIEGESKDIHPRNVIAHCGFERNCIEVRKEKEEIFLRYREGILEKIKEILWKN